MAATIKQIAQKIGMSLPTVSHVLNERGQFTVQTRELVFAAARELGYVPNAAARSMRSRRTKQIGAVYLNEPDRVSAAPHNHFLIAGVNAGLQQAGYVLCLVRATDVTAEDGGVESRVFRERILDGVVVLNAIDVEVERRVEKLVPAVVWADTNHWTKEFCVRRDEVHAGKVSAEALIAGGARRIVWIGADHVTRPEGDHYSFMQRRQGAKDAIEAAGMEWQEIAIEPHYTTDGHRQLRKFLAPCKPEERWGLLVYDGVYRASQILHVAMLERRVVGVDFSLAACDDTPLVSDQLPWLSRVEFDRHLLGIRAAEMILKRLDGENESCLSELHRDRLVAGSTSVLLKPGQGRGGFPIPEEKVL